MKGKISVWPCFLLLALLPGVAFNATAQARRLNVVCSVQIEWCEKIRSAYRKTADVQMTMIRRSSIDTLAMLLSERNNPRTDVWFGGTGDPHLQAAEQGLTLAYHSPQFHDLQAWAQEQAQRGEFRTVGLYSGVLVFAYRPDQLRRIGAKPPQCWRDLTAPWFEGQVMMGNPTSSGAGYLALSALTQIFGEDEAFAFMKKLHRNVAQYTHGGRGGMENMARGEASVAIGFLHDALAARERGADVAFSLPCEGAPAEIGSLSLIAGGANPREALLFYEWALSPEAQALAAEARAFQLPSNRRVSNAVQFALPDQEKLLAYDYRKFGSSETRKRLLTRWINEVNIPANE